MKVYLAHHADAHSAEEDPERSLTELGHRQADRIGEHVKAAGVTPSRILHSDKRWTRETAERVAAVLGVPDRTEMPSYPIAGKSPVEPFIAEIVAGDGDVLMAGHFEFLQRTGSKLLCGDENADVIAFKPGNGTVFCLEGEGDSWTIVSALRPEHMGV